MSCISGCLCNVTPQSTVVVDDGAVPSQSPHEGIHSAARQPARKASAIRSIASLTPLGPSQPPEQTTTRLRSTRSSPDNCRAPSKNPAVSESPSPNGIFGHKPQVRRSIDVRFRIVLRLQLQSRVGRDLVSQPDDQIHEVSVVGGQVTDVLFDLGYDLAPSRKPGFRLR